MSLLHAKLLVPELPTAFVARPALLRTLDAVRARITLVCAPAGWGKTTLLSAWARAAPPTQPVAWLSVEPEDNSDKFWSYVDAALAEATARTGQPLPEPTPQTGPEPAGEHLAEIAEALARRAPPVTLVLDDAHHLDDRELLRGLDFLLRHAAGRLRLVLAGRVEPQLPAHRWRLRGELAELGPADLSFTPAEAAQLLAQHGVVAPAAAHHGAGREGGWREDGWREDGWRDDEGWPAGVRLAALGRSQPSPVPAASGADPRVAEYLLAEVVAEQPPHVRDLLARASVVDRLCGGLVDALGDDVDGASELDRLARSGAFVFAIAEEPGWFRCHRALREVMLDELRRRGQGHVRESHRRAAGWFRANGRPTDALAHALAARDWAKAADLAPAHWCEVLLAAAPPPSSAPPLTGLTRRIIWDHADVRGAGRAAAIADHTGRVALACALHCLHHGALDETEAFLRLASRSGSRSLGMIVGAARLSLAQLAGEPTAVSAAARSLLDRAGVGRLRDAGRGREEPAAEREEPAAALALCALGAAQLDLGELGLARQTLRAAVSRSARAGLVGPRQASLGRSAVLAAHHGELRLAWAQAATALREPGVARTYAHLARAMVELERGRADRAEAELGHGGPVAAGTEPALAAFGALLSCGLGRERGAVDGGVAALRAARDAALSERWRELLTAAEADLRAAAGQTRGLRRSLAHRLRERLDEHGAEFAVVLAQVCLREGDLAAATRALAALAAAGSPEPPLRLRLAAGLVEALATHRGGDAHRSRRCLERVLCLAAPEGYRRPFARHGAELRPLLLAHLDSGTAHWPIVVDLLETTALAPPEHRASAALGLSGPLGPAAAAGPDGPTEALTARELTILRYLQSILSNVEIAGELRVSVNTVKTHLRNIYRKLGAPRRREAVRRARELRLL